MFNKILILTLFLGFSVVSQAGNRTVWTSASLTIEKPASVPNTDIYKAPISDESTTFLSSPDILEYVISLRVENINSDNSVTISYVLGGEQKWVTLSQEDLDRVHPLVLEAMNFSFDKENSWVQL